MKNKEIEELLNMLRKCAREDKATLKLNEIACKTILSCIEQLENNRDKALRIIDKYKETYIICFDIEQWNFVKRLEKCLQRYDK